MLTRALENGTWLRLIEERDAEQIYATVAANRAYLAQWMPWAAGQTLETTIAFVRESRRQLADDNGMQTAIVQDGRIVGVIGYQRVDWRNRSTSIGYWLAEDAQGRGTMTMAARALVEHAFGPWELNRVDIHAGVENVRSRAIPQRLGFTEEGVLREAELVGERYIDHVVYGMLARDWRSNEGRH